MPPIITKEGQRAKGRLAEFRENINNGATATQARANVRAVEAGLNATSRMNTPRVEGSVSASSLVNPPTPVTVPTPAQPTIPESTKRFTSSVARDVDGFIRSQSERASKLEEMQDTYGALNEQQSMSDMFQQQRKDLGIDTDMAELKDINLRLADATTASNLQKTQIAGAAGQTLGQGQREITQEDRESAVRMAGDAARAAVLQGNIETATQLAKDTVNLAFQDRQLESENMINQINMLQKSVDEETRQLLEQDKREYEADLARIEELKTNISTAMVNGATQSEIAQLNDPRMDDASKLALAQSITARGANQMRNLEMSQKSASIRASNASAALNEAELTAFNKAQEDAANGILSPEQMKTANDVNKDFESQPIVKSYNDGLQKYMVLEDTLANGIDGVQDLQLVYDFMKSVDPTSVVRTEEFENAAKTGNIFEGAFANFNKAFGSGGFLPEQVKQDFVRAARSSFEAKNSQYYNVKSEYTKRMNNTLNTNNGANYLTAYEAAAPLTEADNNIVFGLQDATEQDAQDIMLMVEQLNRQGTQGATIYK